MVANTRHKKWAVKIQHCPISSKFYMWVDNDVPNWFLTLKNFYPSPFSKWPPQYAQIQHCPISTPFHMWVDYDVPNYSWHGKISTGRHFQNGHHNTAQIQHCLISITFHMWEDYDVPNWFLTSKNFYRSPFSKWPPQYRKNSTLFDFKGSFWLIF